MSSVLTADTQNFEKKFFNWLWIFRIKTLNY